MSEVVAAGTPWPYVEALSQGYDVKWEYPCALSLPRVAGSSVGKPVQRKYPNQSLSTNFLSPPCQFFA